MSDSGQLSPAADALSFHKGEHRIVETGFRALAIRSLRCWRAFCSVGERSLNMKKTERVRQVVAGVLSETEVRQQIERGWKLVAVEWEREVETVEEPLPVEVPFGLRVSPETQRLEEDGNER